MRIGIDLGGTKIEILAIDEAGTERLRRRVPTPRHGYEAVIRTIYDLVAETETELGERSTVGVGMPGTLSPATGLVKNANSTWLNGQTFDRDLGAALGRPVRLANDANCLALSEAHDGAAAGAGTVFGVIVGTGVGGGLVVDGKLMVGANAIAGEWGHNPLPWPTDDERPGPLCYCGRQGCIETFLSGPGLAADFLRASGQDVRPEAVIGLAGQGDGVAEATLARYCNRMARALAHVINIVDPEVIVLGGGLSGIDRLYDTVPMLWTDYVFSDHVETRLLRAQHGDSSGVRGAARLWPSDTTISR